MVRFAESYSNDPAKKAETGDDLHLVAYRDGRIEPTDQLGGTRDFGRRVTLRSRTGFRMTTAISLRRLFIRHRARILFTWT